MNTDEVTHWLYQQARKLEKTCDTSFPIVRRCLSHNHWLNPIGGSPLLHGIELSRRRG
ncbi:MULTISPECIES: hypothetical protein [unclassified Brenneria]|uniref:hypothetical protein n=1 Tax=unclassified Brenneria TaxID=2634434 RepID=UPI0029C4826C|nr:MULTISPECIES: hypothetical protein [unclassified Brenneria]MDX5630382.1 hypothetical protein [Brenneria sp. L3-3Z]MDX5697527.1 hypothetical protein [Brenneria sp. L4-2C]